MSSLLSLLAFLVAATVVMAPGAVLAGTVTVDWGGGGDYLTIQEGLDASGYGDTVLVFPGTYNEHLLVESHPGALTLEGVAGAESTIVDNQDQEGHSVLRCVSLAGGISVKGLTLRRGHATSAGTGGGLQCVGACSIVLEGCVIEDCYSASFGGGVDIVGGSAAVVACTIRRNLADKGGGLSADGADLTLTDTEIRENRAQGFGGTMRGGALSVYGGRCTIRRSAITDNYTGGNGGGLHFVHTDEIIVEDNVIARNVATFGGGGAAFSVFSEAHWSGNTVVDNEVHANWGHALVIGDDSTPGQFVAENNVFFGNGDGTKEAIYVSSGAPAITFTANSFSDDSLYEVRISNTHPADTLAFTGNWWGTADPDSIASLIYDCNDDPDVPACVDFSSWCTDPSCAGQVTGVPETPEPVPSSWSRIKEMYG